MKWRYDDEQPSESPTVGSVVICATDTVLDLGGMTLEIKHVRAFSGGEFFRGFMPSLSKGGDYGGGYIGNGSVERGEDDETWDKARIQGYNLLEKYLTREANEVNRTLNAQAQRQTDRH